MAIDFPNSPSLNDIYSFNGRTWQWDGVGWTLINVPRIVGIVTVTGISAETAIAYSVALS